MRFSEIVALLQGIKLIGSWQAWCVTGINVQCLETPVCRYCYDFEKIYNFINSSLRTTKPVNTMQSLSSFILSLLWIAFIGSWHINCEEELGAEKEMLQKYKLDWMVYLICKKYTRNVEIVIGSRFPKQTGIKRVCSVLIVGWKLEMFYGF